MERVRSWVLIAALSVSGIAGAKAGPPARAAASRSASVPSLTNSQQAEFARAQKAVQTILDSTEFRRPEPTLWDRIKAKILDAILSIFRGIDRVATQSPWLGRVLEWLLFIAAATGLLVWVMRTVQRQKLRVAMGGEPARNTTWPREAEDWRRQADQEAAKGAWRDAIHALYWAAIVHLERRRAWRHNPARTPREYVRLLKAGSPEQRDLRGLTNTLEQTWYGQREASAEKFGEARESFERLTDGAGRESVAGGQA